MPVSSPGPEWCPEDGYGRHSGNWYNGGTCKACHRSGPPPDDYFWPGGSGPLFPAVVPAITWRADDWSGRPYDPEDPGPEPMEMAREDGDWDSCEPTL